MRSLTISILLTLAVRTLADSITLTQFQQISGFSKACTDAYKTPISGCTAADFTNGNPCSQACADGLQKETVLLNSACAGISTSPSTLIGLFFQQEGVQTLCPKIGSAPAAAPSASSTTSTIQSSSAAPSTTLISSTSTQATTSSSVSLPTVVSSSSSSTSSSSTTSTSSSSSDSSSTTSTTSTTQSSISNAFSSATATATPFNTFDLNGPRSDAPSGTKSNLLVLLSPMAGLALGMLI